MKIPIAASHQDYSAAVSAFQKKEYGLTLQLLSPWMQNGASEPQIEKLYALAAYQSGFLEKAISALEQAVQASHQDAMLWFNLAVMLAEAGRVDESIVAYRKTLEISPDYFAAYENLGLIFLEGERLSEAVELLEAGLSYFPENAFLWEKLSVANRYLPDFEGSEYCIRKSLSHEKTRGRENILGMILQEQGKSEEALSVFEKILSEDPGHIDAEWNRSLVFLDNGKVEEGWDGYESRLKKEKYGSYLSLPFPVWQGESLEGKGILVLLEQGLGEELVFSTCFHELIAQSKHCVIICSEKLSPIFKRTFSQAKVYGVSEPKDIFIAPEDFSRIDYSVAMGSLPKYFRSSLSSFENKSPCLKVDSNKKAYWDSRLSALGDGLKIGFSWRSGIDLGVRSRNYPFLERFMGVFSNIPNSKIINLQVKISKRERTVLEKSPHNFSVFEECDLWDDLDNSAALMKSLDLIVSPTTTIALLAGALGCRVLVPHYRKTWHMLGQSHYPWFKNMKVFFPEDRKDWSGVLKEMQRDLEQIKKEKS